MEALEKKIDEKFGLVFQKLEVIIKRNGEADLTMAVMNEKLTNHIEVDKATFKIIDVKHGWYDKLIYGALISSIGELIFLLFHK